MTEHEASRTLVKSPPELWAECSDAASLARHLGQFGEIRITRLEPETAVAWEGERASGTVRLEPSGWGTRVVLTAQAASEDLASAGVDELGVVGETEAADSGPEPADPGRRCRRTPAEAGGGCGARGADRARTRTGTGAGARCDRRSLRPSRWLWRTRARHVTPRSRRHTEVPRLGARSGFIARFFGRLSKRAPSPVVLEAAPGADVPVKPAPLAAAPAEPAAETATPAASVEAPVTAEESSGPAPPTDPAPAPEPPTGSIRPAEPTLDPAAALTAALDSLGQAHHRPFSRA